MEKLWSINMYKSGNVYKVKINDFKKGKPKMEGVGSTQKTAYRDAIDKLSINIWSVNKPPIFL